MEKSNFAGILKNLDEKFCQDTGGNNVDAWVSYFAENGVMLTGTGPIIGKEEIYEIMGKSFSLNGYSLQWEPLYAKASNDGTMGYTYGKYIRSSKDSDGKTITASGHYTSIWEKQEDGEWKIVLDMGN
jgi:ketosteroid isomerase-like protein